MRATHARIGRGRARNPDACRSGDPRSVFAWSFLSNTYTTDLLNRWMHLRGATHDDWLRRGEEAADKPFALDADDLYAIEARATTM